MAEGAGVQPEPCVSTATAYKAAARCAWQHPPKKVGCHAVVLDTRGVRMQPTIDQRWEVLPWKDSSSNALNCTPTVQPTSSGAPVDNRERLLKSEQTYQESNYNQS